MDTFIQQRPQIEKMATGVASIGIALCLICIQNLNISAKDITIMTGFSPTLNYIQEEQRHNETIFEEAIRQKYKNSNVQEYMYATAFEGLIGYLHLSKQKDRLEEILCLSLKLI